MEPTKNSNNEKPGLRKAPQTKFDKPMDDRHKNWWILDKIAGCRKKP